MVSISLCMIVRDEEESLARCLQSVCEAVDEIIIVDTGSIDATKEIAKSFTDKIFDFIWNDDFAAARNYSFAMASMDYILWLDADDILPPESLEELKQLKTELDTAVQVVMMPYHTAFGTDGRPLFAFHRERLIKNHAGFFWHGAVHEAIKPTGLIIYRDIPVEHRKLKPGDPDRNLRIYENLLADGAELNPRERYYYARELYYHERYPEAAAELESFLAMPGGWLENRVEAHLMRAQCLKKLGQEEKALSVLLCTLLEDRPRAEVCCEIGQLLLNNNSLRAAIFWYETAASCNINMDSGAFIDLDCYTFLPYIHLCVCHYRLGNFDAAKRYHRLAAAIHPDAPSVQHNQQFFPN